jgi:hypothetical protein
MESKAASTDFVAAQFNGQLSVCLVWLGCAVKKNAMDYEL